MMPRMFTADNPHLPWPAPLLDFRLATRALPKSVEDVGVKFHAESLNTENSVVFKELTRRERSFRR